MTIKTKKHESEISALRDETKLLSERNTSSQCQLDKIESFQSRNNLRIDSIKEVNGEDLDVIFGDICNSIL